MIWSVPARARSRGGVWHGSAVTLDELLTEEGALPVGRALAILGAVARQLDGLAAAGGVHGDVAPANIEVDDSGPARLRPASPAMDRASLAEIGSWSGHLEYVAPERIRGEPPTPAADRYAFAAVAFETLTGEPPYVREDRAAMLYAHLVDPPPAASSVRPELPEALDDPLARGLDKRPERRAESAAAIVSALAAAAGLPDSAPPPEPPAADEAPKRPARRRGRRRPIAIGALVLAVVGAGAVAGYLFATRGGGGRPVSASTAGPVSAALVAQLPPLPARLPLGTVLPDRLAGWTVTAVDPLAANLPLPADYRFEAAQLSRGDDRALALGIGVPPEGDVTGLLQDVERSLDGRPVARVALARGKGTLRRAGAAHMIAFADRRRVLVAIAASTPAAVAAARALGRAAA
jgi:Protein kinase domain